MITLEPPRGMPDEADGWTALDVSRAALTRFVRSAQRLVGLEGGVDVLLAPDATLRRLNRDFRGKNKATDVLSFPAPAELRGTHAGDLAISVETAARQGREHGHTLALELRVLLLHGLLHLAGMDHEVDRGEMRAREAELRERLRLPAGLIDRVEGGAGAAAVKAVRARSGGAKKRSGGGAEVLSGRSAAAAGKRSPRKAVSS